MINLSDRSLSFFGDEQHEAQSLAFKVRRGLVMPGLRGCRVAPPMELAIPNDRRR